MYCFLTKTGKLRKNYLEVCQYILTSKMDHHIITVGRYDDVVDEYDCYTTGHKKLYAKERRSFEEKILSICKEFNINPHFWYSYLDISVDFRGEIKDVEFMLKELKKYIKRI